MDWLSELIRHITISRSFTGAVFVTAVAILFGHRWFPGYLDAPAREWVPIATGISVFSGALLVFWLIAGVWALGVAGFKFLRERRKNPAKLSVREFTFLQMLSECDNESLDLNNVDYRAGQLSKLEVHELVDQLAKQELLYRNGFDENLIFMTPEGRRAVLAIQRQIQGPRSGQRNGAA